MDFDTVSETVSEIGAPYIVHTTGIETSPSLHHLAEALATFQGAVESAPKDGTNPHFKSRYATLDSLIKTIKKPLADNGLSFMQLPCDEKLVTMLLHRSGEFVQAGYTMPVKDRNPQTIGSALMYMRRYALSAILGLATEEDDDANEASPAPTVASAPVPQMFGRDPRRAVGTAISPAERTEQPKSLKQMWAVVRGKHKVDETAFRGYCTALGVQSTTELTGEQIATVIAIVEHEESAAFAPFVQLEKVATLPDEGWRKTLMKETAQLYALEGDSELVQQCIKVLEDVQATPGTANHLRHKIADTMLVAQETE